MIREVNITNLEKGFIDEDGNKSTSSEYIRTSSRLTYDGAFLKLDLPFHAIKNLPVIGSFDGTTGYRYNTGAGTALASYTNNANYKVIYYWAFIYRTNPETGNVTVPCIGHFMIRVPVSIGTFVGDPAYIARKNIPQNSDASGTLDKYLVGTSEDYDALTPESTITYYSSGTSGSTVTKTAKEFVFGTRYVADTDRVEFVLKGERDSEMARCKAGIITYSKPGDTGGQVIHSERWIDVPTVSNTIYVLPYAPVAKMLMVFQIVDVSNPAVNEIVNPKLKYVDDGWELNEDDILLNSGLPEKVDTPTFVPPYPATMWYLDDRDKLKNALLPEYLPVGAFALTTELEMIRLPESLEEIGKEAFYGSAIRRVIIPNNTCTYYSTSFPPDCVVTGGRKID